MGSLLAGGLEALSSDAFECVHGGFYNQMASDNPNPAASTRPRAPARARSAGSWTLLLDDRQRPAAPRLPPQRGRDRAPSSPSGPTVSSSAPEGSCNAGQRSARRSSGRESRWGDQRPAAARDAGGRQPGGPGPRSSTCAAIRRRRRSSTAGSAADFERGLEVLQTAVSGPTCSTRWRLRWSCAEPFPVDQSASARRPVDAGRLTVDRAGSAARAGRPADPERGGGPGGAREATRMCRCGTSSSRGEGPGRGTYPGSPTSDGHRREGRRAAMPGSASWCWRRCRTSGAP